MCIRTHTPIHRFPWIFYVLFGCCVVFYRLCILHYRLAGRDSTPPLLCCNIMSWPGLSFWIAHVYCNKIDLWLYFPLSCSRPCFSFLPHNNKFHPQSHSPPLNSDTVYFLSICFQFRSLLLSNYWSSNLFFSNNFKQNRKALEKNWETLQGEALKWGEMSSPISDLPRK